MHGHDPYLADLRLSIIVRANDVAVKGETDWTWHHSPLKTLAPLRNSRAARQVEADGTMASCRRNVSFSDATPPDRLSEVRGLSRFADPKLCTHLARFLPNRVPGCSANADHHDPLPPLPIVCLRLWSAQPAMGRDLGARRPSRKKVCTRPPYGGLT